MWPIKNESVYWSWWRVMIPILLHLFHKHMFIEHQTETGFSAESERLRARTLASADYAPAFRVVLAPPKVRDGTVTLQCRI